MTQSPTYRENSATLFSMVFTYLGIVKQNNRQVPDKFCVCVCVFWIYITSVPVFRAIKIVIITENIFALYPFP